MIIELIGPPGAGKSELLQATTRSVAAISGCPALDAAAAVDRLLSRTLAGRLTRPLLGGRPRRRRTLLVDFPYGVASLVARPRLSLAVASAILRSPVAWDHRWTLLMRWVGVAARQRFLRARLGTDVAVFDEGLYHRSVNLFAWRHAPAGSLAAARVERQAAAYLRLVPAPDVAIFVDAEPRILDARVSVRGVPIRLRGRAPDRVAEFLTSAGRVVRLVHSRARSFTTWVSVDNSTSLEAAIADLERGLAIALGRRIPPQAAWPLEPGRRSPVVRRPDRAWRNRARSLTDAERRTVVDVCHVLGVGNLAQARSIGVGRSFNVVVETKDGPFLLKRYKPTLEDAAIASEHAILRRLSELGLPGPRLVAGPDGETCARLGDATFAAFEYVEGFRPMHELLAPPPRRRRWSTDAGRALALLHDALAGDEPVVHPSTGLDADGRRFGRSGDLADILSGEAQRLALTPAAGHAHGERLRELDGLLTDAGLRATLIHGDYGPYNILVKRGQPLMPIDFELARPDWRLLDVVTAAPRFAQSRIGFSRERFEAFLDGYLHVDGALGEELRHAPALLELLQLRRAATCLRRAVNDPDEAWLREARTRLGAAESIRRGTHRTAAAFEALGA